MGALCPYHCYTVLCPYLEGTVSLPLVCYILTSGVLCPYLGCTVSSPRLNSVLTSDALCLAVAFDKVFGCASSVGSADPPPRRPVAVGPLLSPPWRPPFDASTCLRPFCPLAVAAAKALLDRCKDDDGHRRSHPGGPLPPSPQWEREVGAVCLGVSPQVVPEGSAR